ncbi:DUF4350 domain-containing protein [Microbacterium sp. G2-8]|uniref:DUF4350 domain-containing protein n=1 Tax=Microbacterium sp. G2-8 TaxID=2842454 RepID=UPI001C8A5D07|nr:DUF4350 domain-containing protein [Microbacterium sp. G2-8]
MSLVATTAPRDAGPRPSRRRRVWGWVAVVVAICVVGSVLALLEHSWSAPDPLDPDSPRYDGARAVTSLLADQGTTVTAVDRAADAHDAIDAAGTDATLVITDAWYLTSDALAELADRASETVVLGSDYATLDPLFPGIGYGGAGSASEPVAPQCTLPAAENAGAILPGAAYSVDAPGVTGCYPVDDGHALLRTETSGGSALTLVDGQALFENDVLAEEGHAALALGLLGQRGEVIWYSPSPADAEASDANPAIGDFVPPWVTPVIVLGLLITIAAGVWRGRRFGPLVAESLPVTVRAGETLEGRARLYRTAGDPAHALDVLRRGAIARLARRLGLSADAARDEVARAAAAVLGFDPRVVHDTLTATPQNDADFADLGERLRDLETAIDSADPWEGRSR